MAQTNVMDVHVKQLTKFGFQNERDEYIGWSKQLKDADKAQVVPGRKFSVEMYIADSGKQYVNKVLRQLDSLKVGDNTPVIVPNVTPSSMTKPHTTTKVAPSESMSKAEWSAKDRSQLIGGLSHDAATLTAAMSSFMPNVTTEEALVVYKELLVGMLKIRDEVK